MNMKGLDQISVFVTEQKRILEKLFKQIISIYGDRLITLAIFGSYARGEPKLDSDLDIFIILKDKKGISSEINLFQEKIETVIERDLQKLYEKFGINFEISPIILSKDEAVYFNPLYLDMADNSIIIFDKDNFLGRILKIVKQKKRKIKKVLHGNTYLWEMIEENLLGEKLL